MSRRLLAIALGAAVVLTALPGVAAAKVHRIHIPVGHVIQLHLRATGGYRIDVTAGRHRQVVVSATRGTTVAYYVLKGQPAGEDGIDAKLPGVGVIAVRFVANGRERQRPTWENCGGGGRTVHYGTVRGRIRLHGEASYTEVATSRAKARLITWPSQHCRYRTPEHKPWNALFEAFYEAGGGLEDPTLELNVIRYARWARPAAREVVFKAFEYFFRGGMFVFREASATTDASTFITPEARTVPEHLIFTPPPPFQGTATLERTPESTFAWTGSLSVSLPGVGRRRLAGPEFESRYCALGTCFDQFVEEDG